MIEHSIFGDPFTVKSFADAATTLSAIAHGDNPVAFVSGSPWSFYRRTIQKLHRDGFPEGPLILKDVVVNSSSISFAGTTVPDAIAAAKP